MVEVIFDDGKYNVASKIYAYDYGQKLRIWGLQLPEIVEAHFSRCGSESALLSMGTCEDNVSIIPIPDAMLTAPGAFRCAIFIRGDGEGESAYMMRFEILKRPGIPTAVTEPTEQEISYFESVLDAMRVMLGQAGDAGQGGTGGETIDPAPTEDSANLVTSGGVYTALEGKAEIFNVTVTSTYNESTQEYEYSCNKTYSEILAAATNGKYVYAYFDRVQSIMPMVLCGPQIWFGYSQLSSVVAGKAMACIYIIITSDGIRCSADNVVVAEQSALTALEQRVAALEQAIGNT